MLMSETDVRGKELKRIGPEDSSVRTLMSAGVGYRLLKRAEVIHREAKNKAEARDTLAQLL